MALLRSLAVAVFLTLPRWLFAQSDDPVGGHFGVKVGAGLTRLSVSGTTMNIPKQNLDGLIGVMYRYRLHRLVAQPELIFSQRGGTFQVIQTNGRQTNRNHYNYLSVPLLLGYIPTEGLTIQAGPEFSYALNAGAGSGPGSTTDVGAVLGIHYDFLDMLAQYSLHLRYVYGLTNVSPEAGASYYNRTFQAAIVYNLYKKRK